MPNWEIVTGDDGKQYYQAVDTNSAFVDPAIRAQARIAALQESMNILLWRPDSAPVASSDAVSRLPAAPPPIPGRFQNLDFEEMP